MLSCPRCAYAFPYWRSRRWRPRWNLPAMATGRVCPVCERSTTRRPSPLWARPLRLLLGARCSYRHCTVCGWRGLALHAPRDGYRRGR
jgi:hypothetical protein